MIPVSTEVEQYALEDFCRQKGFSSLAMMEEVASGMARILQEQHDSLLRSPRWTFLIGPGNNGADGLALAKHLCAGEGPHPPKIKIFLWECSPENLLGHQLQELKERSSENLDFAPLVELSEKDLQDVLIFEALFGAGSRARELPPWLEMRLEGRKNSYLVAIDQPCGLGKGGELLRSTKNLAANISLSVTGPKRSMLQGEAVDHCGKIESVDLGFCPIDSDYEWVANAEEFLRTHLEKLKFSPSAHKHRRLKVLSVGGALQKGGAQRLVAEAALRMGASWVTIVSPENRSAEKQSFKIENYGEWLYRESPKNRVEWSELLEQHQAVVFGCGLVEEKIQKSEYQDFFEALVSCQSIQTIVVDGGGQKLFSESMASLSTPVAFTPHSKEARDLLGRELSGDRFTVFEDLQKKLFEKFPKGGLLLKGAYPIVSGEPRKVFDLADGRLGVAGSGDVLSGVVVALTTNHPLDRALALGIGLQKMALKLLGPSFKASQLAESMQKCFWEIQKGLDDS